MRFEIDGVEIQKTVPDMTILNGLGQGRDWHGGSDPKGFFTSENAFALEGHERACEALISSRESLAGGDSDGIVRP